MKAKVTILLATCNRAHLIGETLDSIKAQTFTNWECIIIDDDSSDNTQEIVEELIKTDKRFSFFKKPQSKNKGLSASRNYGLELAKNQNPDYIQFFDDDDLMHPKKLELQIELLQRDTTASFCLCGTKNFKFNKEINYNENSKLFYNNKFFIGEAYLIGDIRFVAQVPIFRYNYVKEFQFDEELFYAEEWALFSMQFLLTNPKFTQVDKVLFYRRKHPISITESKDENFYKRKASAITGIKIVKFLSHHKIHTKVTLFYFFRQFLIYKFDSRILDTLQSELKGLPEGTRFDAFKFKTARYFHWLTRKIILKILNF